MQSHGNRAVRHPQAFALHSNAIKNKIGKVQVLLTRPPFSIGTRAILHNDFLMLASVISDIQIITTRSTLERIERYREQMVITYPLQGMLWIQFDPPLAITNLLFQELCNGQRLTSVSHQPSFRESFYEAKRDTSH
jgi:hypothetical protein